LLRPESPRALLECRDVRKSYAGRCVVEGMSFEVREGEIVGLLGPNGAGKTTLMRALLGLVPHDSGEVLLDGVPLQGKVKEQLGYLPEERGLPAKARIDETLCYLLRLRGLSSRDAAHAAREGLAEVGLSDYAKKDVAALSKGLLGRLTFVAATAHRPRLLVLDEPFSGLDPVGILWMQEAIERCRAHGASVLLSAHQMHLVERLCDRVVMIARGKRVLYGSLPEIRQAYPADRILVSIERSDLDLSAVLSHPTVRLSPQQYEVTLDHAQGPALLADLCARGIAVCGFQPVVRTLEEVFLELVGYSATRGDDATALTSPTQPEMEASS
jgi:ABC-2 type transport system ATP-binding protein